MYIFQSADAELPRSRVADFLETIDPKICVRFIEYLIKEKGEDSLLSIIDLQSCTFRWRLLVEVHFPKVLLPPSLW